MVIETDTNGFEYPTNKTNNLQEIEKQNNVTTNKKWYNSPIFWIIIGVFLWAIVISLFLNSMKESANKACEEIGLRNEKGGNCCFIEGEKNIAFPCDKLISYSSFEYQITPTKCNYPIDCPESKFNSKNKTCLYPVKCSVLEK